LKGGSKLISQPIQYLLL